MFTPELLILTGSRLYGTSTPSSDEDFRGFCIPTRDYLLGRKTFEQSESKEPDQVVWSLLKFFKLLEIGSPNVTELLFTSPENIQGITTKGRIVLDHRSYFISQRWLKPIIGFAESEWKSVEKSVGDTGEFRSKSASHAIRLLQQGIELMGTGTITFPRPNANDLLRYKRGEVSYKECYHIFIDSVNEFRKAEEKVALSLKPANDKITDLYYDLIKDQL